MARSSVGAKCQRRRPLQAKRVGPARVPSLGRRTGNAASGDVNAPGRNTSYRLAHRARLMTSCGGSAPTTHRSKLPGDRIYGEDLTRGGPLQKHRYMQVEAMAELAAAGSSEPKQIPCAA